MNTKLKGYSLLEIILVTTFIIIFIVVTNPATYISRFSKMLLKMSVLNESELLVNKLNSFAYSSCNKQTILPTSFVFNNDEGIFSLSFSSGSFLIKNLSTNLDAILYRNVNVSTNNQFNYYDLYFSETNILNDVGFIDLSLNSSLLTHEVKASILCDDHNIVLGEF